MAVKDRRCTTSNQRDLSLGQPILEFVTITVPAGISTIGIDLPVKFKQAHTFFMIVSILSTCADAMVAISFVPAGYNNSAGLTGIVPTGGEQWIPFSNKNNSAGKAEGRFIKFDVPVQNFFLTADHPSNNPASGSYLLTIMGTDDIEMVISERT